MASHPQHPPLDIVFEHLGKRFGRKEAVRDVSARIEPGRVTGFLGPNGAGTTTVLKMLLGLVAPTSGSARIGGRRYAELAQPVARVGVALELPRFARGRNARDHLRLQAPQAGVDGRRIDEVLEFVGLTQASRSRVGTFSLGMRQRLSLAGALLADPPVLILDEPTNGLDPAGIAWLRTLVRQQAAVGKTVLVSSHLLSEVGQTVDDALVLSEGSLVFAGPIRQLVGHAQERVVHRVPPEADVAPLAGDPGLLDWTLDTAGALVTLREGDAARVLARLGLTPEQAPRVRRDPGTLEDAFFEVVRAAGERGGRA
jgi:ABC-2 type transport system ATP-binding protein